MDKNDIINYVMKTPQNTNPAILGEMLDSYGGSSSPLIVHYSDDSFTTLDHTWQEIVDAMPLVWIEVVNQYGGTYFPILSEVSNNALSKWTINIWDPVLLENHTASTNDPNGYPVIDQ